MKCLSPILAAGLVVISGTAFAGEQLSVVGSWSGLPLHKQYEAPFWTDKISSASNGRITANLTTHDQMGIKGGDVFRMLGDGIFDVGMTVADYAVSDAPALEGLDVPLVATDAAAAYKMVKAARPLVDDIFRDVFKAKVLGIAPYPPQVVFCNADIKGLGDLKGKKIRASGRMTAKLLEALGAEGVTIGFGEVPGALQRGVVDCAITGAGSGYSAGWWEVTTHLMPIPLGGWDPVVTAINYEKWDSLSAEDQTLLQEQVTSQLEKPAWDSAQNALQADIACLTGEGDCAGEKRNLKLVKVSQSDLDNARDILINQVLPAWAKRAGGNWGKRWNETVGKVTGVEIRLE
ncbi:MAG: TRAP transporter substrate-binding protein [Cohaesibacteraceae bacterium]|nr:TRAP transporter substrate-binding protein [Cohaesibacteraceae bacterium]MBL4876858.1 TRAP transporter substrate-binding protein [Cohaesibacteraceae bacterium]